MTATKRRDLTTGSIPRLLGTLAAPAMLDMTVGSIAMLVHAYWMGRVGGTALASVAMGTTLRVVLISPVMGLSAGGQAVVSRHIGAGEQRKADNGMMQSILLLFLIVMPISIIGQIFCPTFLRWMGAEGEVARDAVAYLRIILGGLFFIECLPSMSGVMRSAGHPEYTLRISLVNVIVLSIVEPIVVLGLGPIPPMGVRGAAVASVAGSFSGVMAQLVLLRGTKLGVSLHRQDLRLDFGTMRRILKVAMPASLNRFSPNLSNALLMRLVSAQGDLVLSAWSLVSRLGGVLQATARGAASAATAMMGQNLGAGKPDRSAQSTRLTTIGAMLVIAVCYVLLNLWPKQVLAVFGQTGEAAQASQGLLRWYALYAIASTGRMVLGNALSGAGDTLSPMLVNMGALWLVMLPLAWLLSQRAGIGATGIWVSLVMANVVGAIAIYGRFLSGRWRRIVV